MKRENAIIYSTLENWNIQSYLPINEHVYSVVLSSLKKENQNKTAQSHIIIGADGSGKTTILKRIAFELSKLEAFHAIVIDGQKLFSLDDIWKYCSGGYKNTLDWQEQHKQRVVLLIDNIQYLFQRISDAEQFSLRGNLNSPGAPILVGTSNEVLPAFTDYKAAFFDGLKLSYIHQVDNETIRLIGFSERELNRVNTLLAYLPKTVRSLMLIKRVLRLSYSDKDDLNMLCDLLAPAFRLKLDNFVAPNQRILLALASSESGMTLLQLREATQLGNGKLSPYLSRLTVDNILEKISSSSRNATYRIKDSLFRLWLTKI
jgi:hypothetical protein